MNTTTTTTFPAGRARVRTFGWSFLVLFLLGFAPAWAQTTLISSLGDGNFEGATPAASNWVAVNSSTDSWVTNTAAGSVSGTRAAYITSNVGGAPPPFTYSQVSTIQHLYYDVTLPTGEPIVQLSFNWRVGGEGSGANDWDNLKVFWGLTSAINPVANTPIGAGFQVSGPGAVSGMYKLNSAGFNAETFGFSGTPGQTYRLVFSWKSDITDIANPPAAIDAVNLVSSTPGTFTATANGGLWNSPATWVGGTVPLSGNDVVIPAGSTVSVNQVLNYRDLNVNGTLNWAATSVANISGNVTVGATGNLFLSTALSAGQTINIAGNLTNDGSINAAAPSTFINFNGTGNSEINGSGTFVGTGGRGVIRTLGAQNNGTFTLNQTQNITLTAQVLATCNNFVTNNRLRIDNAVDVFQNSVSQIVTINMGTGYTTAPIVTGTGGVLPWTAGGAAALNTRYYFGDNIYIAVVGGTFDGVNPPVGTAVGPAETNGTVTLRWIANTGTIGNPILSTALAAGTQYFCGDNLYTCVTAGAIGNNDYPTHTSGTATYGTAVLAYVGTAAKVTLNWDATTQTVRSLNLTTGGSGYSSIPTIVIVNTGAGSGAAFSSVMFQAAGALNTVATKATATIFTGSADPRHSNAPAGAAGNGVYSVTAASYGWYNSVPTVGFSAPPLANLVTNQGSGYETAPTVTVTGGTQISGTAMVSTDFQVNVANGRVISVYYTGSPLKIYSVMPTIAISAGAATISWGTCVPTATVNLSNGTNGFITSIDVVNNGYGYVTAPTVALRLPVGGETAALLPSARLQQLNIQWGFFLPQTTSPNNNSIMALLPSNGRINAFTVTNGAQTFTSNVEATAQFPLSTFGGIIDMGGSNNLRFSHPDYAGATGTVGAFVANGSVELSFRGGNIITATRTFPIGGGTGATSQFVHTTGAGTATTGFTYTGMRVQRFNTPTGTVNPGGNITGIRGVRADLIGTGVLTNLNPARIVQMNWNLLDNLVSNNQSIFLAQATAIGGPWDIRSVAGFAGPLANTGNRVTATAAPGPIVMSNTMYFAWANNGFAVPPALEYNVVRTTGNTYNSIAPTALGGDNTGIATTFGSGDDGTSPVIDLNAAGNAFTYQGQLVTGFRISTNGNIQLQTAGGATGSAVFSNNFANAELLNVIAPFWDDLTSNPNSVAGANNAIRYLITGTAPNRTLTVEWANFTVFGAAGPQLFFQVQMVENTGVIRFNYGDIQMFNGTNDHRYSYSTGLKGRYAGTYPDAGQVFALKFENSNYWSNTGTQTANIGSNGLLVSPEPRSSYVFTPGPGYVLPAVPVITTPANDNVGSAEAITALSAFPSNIAWNAPQNKSRIYTTRGATASPQPFCGGPTNAKDVWFSFVANETVVTARIYASGGYIPRVQMLDASLNNIDCQVGVKGGQIDATGTGLTLGDTYYVRVYHDLTGTQGLFTASSLSNGNVSGVSINDGGSNYTVSTSSSGGINGARFEVSGGGGLTFVGAVNGVTGGVITSGAFEGGNDYTSLPTISVESPDWGLTGQFAIVIYAPPINDNCAGAIELTNINTNSCVVGQNRLNGLSTAAATGSPEAAPACAAGPDDDLWYKFTATGSLTNVLVESNGAFNAAFQLWTNPTDNCVAKSIVTPPAGGCVNSTFAGGAEEISFATTAGNVYYVRVYHVGASFGDAAGFNICVTTPTPACVSSSTPAASEQICGGTATTISWSAVPFATVYDVFLDPGTGSPTTLVSADQVGLTYNAGVQGANDYSYLIVPKNANGSAIGCVHVTYNVISPVPSSTTPDSRCGTGTLTLNALGTNLQWWAAPSGGVPLATGTSYTTPSISATTNYYVSAGVSSSGTVQMGTGVLTTTAAGSTPYSGGWEGQRTQYLYRASELVANGLFNGNLTALAFDVTAGVPIIPLSNYTIRVAHTTATALTAYLTPTFTTVLTIPSYTPFVGVNNHTFTTPFNWNGTDNLVVEVCFENDPTGTGGILYDVSSTVRYTTTPFNSVFGSYADNAPSCSATGITINNALRPNTRFSGVSLCSGPRQLVVATVTPPPALTIDVANITVCEGPNTEPVNVTSTLGDFDTYVWSTPGDFTGSAALGFTFDADGASSGTRILTATQSGGDQCVNTVSLPVTVNPRPPVGTATATPNPVCEGTTLALDVTGFIPPAGALLTQNFESGLGAWTITAASTTTGVGNPLLANFQLGTHGVSTVGGFTPLLVNSPGGTTFIRTDADAAGSGVSANTQLTSPVFSLADNYSTANIEFRHYVRSGGTIQVQLSTDGGTTWPVVLANYTTTIGTPTLFVAQNLSLTPYIGQSNLRIRFNYVAGWSFYWAIDDIAINTTSVASTFAWESSINGPVGSGRPFNYNAIPQSEDGATFTVRNTVTASGCFREATVGPVTVTPRPGIPVITTPGGTEYCGAPVDLDITAVNADEFTWSPIATLYTDVNGTIPYPANFNAATVYAALITPTLTITGTATNSVTGCFRTATVNLTTCPPTANFPCDADVKPLLAVNTLGDVTMTLANNLGTAATFLPGQGITAPSCFGTYNRDVWFRAQIPASGVLAVNVQDEAATPMDLIADVFTSSNNLCTGNFTQVACNDQGGFGNNPWVQVTTLAPGQLVYIRVSRKGAAAAPVGSFRIGLSEGAVWSGAFDNNMLQQTDDVNGDNNWKFIDNTRLNDVSNPPVIVVKTGLSNYPVLSNTFNTLGIQFRRNSALAFGSAQITVLASGVLDLDRVGTTNTGFINTNLNTSTRGKILGPGIFNFEAGTKVYNVNGLIDFGGLVIARAGTTVNSNGNMIFLNNSTLLSGNANRDGFDGTGTVVGNIRYQRAGTSTPGIYNYWSSPVNGAPISVLNNGGLGNNIYLYNNQRPGAGSNVLLGWEGPITATSSPTNTAAAMVAGRGYIQTAAGNGNVTFVGTPRQTNVNATVTTTPGNNFNLIGNPYPSALNLSNTGANPTTYFFGNNTGVNGAYLWRNLNLPPYGGAGYITINSVGLSGATAVAAGVPSFTLPHVGAAQAFMVEVINGTTGVNLNGTMRLTSIPGNNPQFLDVNEFSTARIRIYNADESQSYETMLAFKEDATDGIDHQQDAVRFPVPLGLEVYTINGNNNFVIQALPTLHNGRVIPMGTQMAVANGSYKIRLTEFSNFDESTRVYLEDLATGAFHNLSQNNTYDFVNMPWAGDRFKLHFRAPIVMAATGACAGDASGKLILNNPNPTAATLTVKNAEGMTIAQESNWIGDKVINNLSTGNYNIAIAYEPTDVINMNASIANGSLTAPATFSASSTVVTLTDASIQFTGNNNGATTYSWNFGDGNTVNGVLNPVHTYTAAGQYTVTFTTSSNGCESTTTKVINVNGTVGINDIANGNSFSIYPNPSADIAYVMLNMAANEKDVMVSIIDGAGRVVSKERVNEVRNGSVVTLNVSEIANGIYEVVVENRNFRAIGKLSVTH